MQARSDPMKIIAVSISKPVEIEYNGNRVKTGIFNKPVTSTGVAR